MFGVVHMHENKIVNFVVGLYLRFRRNDKISCNSAYGLKQLCVVVVNI